ncbi:MAG: HAMP domain-containing sensor histidine kinase [Rhodospirillales bacterium]|jgi:signal transduction histidine kinase|nr:HAMP domain-containing sensor histidine kinase [Rhodospirillales bacterium]|tara:strand:+ start:826 stop:1620 length:795 start_codon:yes stop_codon:yes gene_type:complete
MAKSDKKAKKALKDAQKALERVLKNENAFKDAVRLSVRSFAHDIKNPLNALIGYSQLMCHGTIPPEKYLESAEVIDTAAKRMLALRNSMLEEDWDDKNGTQGPAEDEVQDFEVADMIGEVETLFQQTASDRDIDFSTRVSEDFPTLHTVPQHIYRALTNTLSNAMKFTAGGGNVSLKAEMDGSGDAVLFVIRDSGEGIPATQLKEILKPYKTTVSARGDEGTGLGLPIVNQLMLELGGRMEISSREHQGTKVTLRFPKTLQAAA